MTSMRLTGDARLKALLDQLAPAVQKKGLVAAVKAGAKPISKAAKTRANRESGLLAEALAVKVKTYSSGVAVAIVGVNKAVAGEFKGHKRVPANYLHLVDRGTAPHAIGKGSNLRKGSFAGRLFPGAKASLFMEHAEAASAAQAGDAAADKIEESVQREAAKLGGVAS
jgi:HK97 gp10 family phage protein